MGRKELIMLEEQTVLSRERTMQQYIATGLAFIGLGVLVLKVFIGELYMILGAVLLVMGFSQIGTAYYRFVRYRKVARKLRRKEKSLRLDVGE